MEGAAGGSGGEVCRERPITSQGRPCVRPLAVARAAGRYSPRVGATEQALAGLLKELRDLRVADSDLETALGYYFPFSRSEGGSVDYFADGEFALSATYTGRGTLSELRPGPWLSEANLEDLRRSIRESLLTTVWRIARSVQFGLIPVEGAWRYRDRFQVLPVPPEAPKSPQLMTNQPFILEVRYAGVQDPIENALLEASRAAEAVTEAGLLLAGLVPRIGFARGPRSVHAWARELGPGAVDHSKWIQLGYTFPGFYTRADTFADASSYPPMRLIDAPEFYSRLGISSADLIIDLPAPLESLLDTFFGISPDESKQFIHWCFWLNHAKDAGARSAAHVAVIQAIEALMPNAQDSVVGQFGRGSLPCPMQRT